MINDFLILFKISTKLLKKFIPPRACWIINDFSALLKYQLYFYENPLLLRQDDYNLYFVMNAIYFQPAKTIKVL